MRHFKRLKKDFLSNLKSYIDYNLSPKDEIVSNVEACYNEPKLCDAVFEAPAEPMPMASSPMPCFSNKRSTIPTQASFCKSIPNIESIKKKPSFADNLFMIIDNKGIKDSKVYRKADIDRRLFSKIRSDANYHPSKSTCIKLCLALELDIVQTEILLETAGYCLSMSSTADLIIRYCINNQTFNIVEVNEALDYFSESILK